MMRLLGEKGAQTFVGSYVITVIYQTASITLERTQCKGICS